MTPEERRLQQETRRHFFGRMGVGIGQLALTEMLAGGKLFGAETKSANPMAPRAPHFAPKVKSVIFLHMAGGPSQLDLFDYKPKLNEYDSILGNNRTVLLLSSHRELFDLLFAPPQVNGTGKTATMPQAQATPSHDGGH